MPLGSSSATPVMSPGPTRARGCSLRRVHKRWAGFGRGDSLRISGADCISFNSAGGDKNRKCRREDRGARLKARKVARSPPGAGDERRLPLSMGASRSQLKIIRKNIGSFMILLGVVDIYE